MANNSALGAKIHLLFEDFRPTILVAGNIEPPQRYKIAQGGW
jgi:hypothetical protein